MTVTINNISFSCAVHVVMGYLHTNKLKQQQGCRKKVQARIQVVGLEFDVAESKNNA